MPKWLLLALVAGGLDAAVIRGVVVENLTGKPLARALVVAQPVSGTQGPAISVRTNSYGAFELTPLPAGAFLVTASKRSFATLQFGQKNWTSAGVPIVVEQNAAPFLNLRLQRFGAIGGSVVDENDVGLPEHDVVVYRNSRPPQLAGKARTDDRGVYRIGGLEPGSYLIRTVGKQYEDGGYLPTFAGETARLDESRAVEVNLDQQVEDVTVKPFPGQLFQVAGQAQVFPPVPVTVTLFSEMGSETVVSDSAGNFRFQPQAPGNYELFAQAPSSNSRAGMNAGYRPLQVDRDRTDHRITLGPMPDIRVILEDRQGQPVDPRKVQVVARRKELSGDGAPQPLRVSPPPQSPAKLMPGRWEVSMAATPAYYVAGFSGPTIEAAERGRPDGWNEIVLAGSNPETLKFVLSPTPASVHGVVSNGGRDPVPGAPVFLEAYDPNSHKRLLDVQVTRSDVRGQFQFLGLAPGTYRVLASFEFQMPDQAALDAANAAVLKTEEGRDTNAELTLYVIQ